MKTALLLSSMAVFLLIGYGTSSDPQKTQSEPNSDLMTSQLTGAPIVETQPNSGPPLPTTSPTATSVPILDLERLILVERDMPEGFTLVKQERLDNRKAARESSDPESWLANFETWGRIEGFRVEFETGVLEDSIYVIASGMLTPVIPGVYSPHS